MKSTKKKVKSKRKKYDTQKQKIKTLEKTGSIITFKKPFFWNGERFMQIMVQQIEKKKKGSIKILGFSRNTEWFKSMKTLIKAVNWKLMEAWNN